MSQSSMVKKRLKRWLVNKLARLIFTADFTECDEKKRFRIYQKMNADDDIKLLFRSLYTRNYHACTLEEDEILRAVIKGRMLAYKNTLDMMDGATEILKPENWKRREKFKKQIKDIRRRLIPKRNI